MITGCLYPPAAVGELVRAHPTISKLRNGNSEQKCQMSSEIYYDVAIFTRMYGDKP